MALREMTVQLNQWYQGFKASSWGQMPGLSVMVELSLLGHFQWGASDPVCQIICCNPLLSYLTGARCPARRLYARKRNTVSLPLSVLPACLCGTVTQGTDHSRLSASMLTCPPGVGHSPVSREEAERWTIMWGNIRSLAGFTRTLAAGRECSTCSLKYLCESERGLMRHRSL